MSEQKMPNEGLIPDSVKNLAKGMAVTFRHMISTMFRGGAVTTQYPKEFREKPDRFHGRHVLNRYPRRHGKVHRL